MLFLEGGEDRWAGVGRDPEAVQDVVGLGEEALGGGPVGGVTGRGRLQGEGPCQAPAG